MLDFKAKDGAEIIGKHHRKVAAYALAAAESAIEDDSFAAAERLVKIGQTNAAPARDDDRCGVRR